MITQVRLIRNVEIYSFFVGALEMLTKLWAKYKLHLVQK
jgi:hypothetical protein